jgi:RNA polymerase sigma-70 factor (ECF subfamily)
MEDIDKSLIDAHIGGDTAAFNELVRRHGDNLLSYLTRISSNKEQAEDLFQETFKRVHQKAHTFSGGRFKSWLYKIATRAAIDSFRREKRFRVVSLGQADCDGSNCPQLAELVLADNSYDPSDRAARAEQAEQVKQAVMSLPDRQRVTLVLAYYQQLSYPEVAEVLGCSVGTVKTQMFRALRTLAHKLPDV